MELYSKIAKLALYGSGDKVYIAATKKSRRFIVFDDKAILTVNWEDTENIDEIFSISVNRDDLLSVIGCKYSSKCMYQKSFYLTVDTVNSKLMIFDRKFIGSLNYSVIDCNRFNHLYSGLEISQSEITGSVCVDFDKMKSVLDFINGFICSGNFGWNNLRIVNIQIVNEKLPMVLQAFIKIDDILFDLDVAICNFNNTKD